MQSTTGNPPKQPPDASGDTTSRFVAPQQTPDDLLQSQTIGLVQLSDFRKRRAEVLQQSARLSGDSSGASTPNRYAAMSSLGRC
jgi:protein FAM50